MPQVPWAPSPREYTNVHEENTNSINSKDQENIYGFVLWDNNGYQMK